MAVDEVSADRADAGCQGCSATGQKRCAPFASVGREKCRHFPECCNWCRITWCPNNRARELYASLHSEQQILGQAR